MSNFYNIGLRGKTTLVLGGLILLALIIISVASYWQSQRIAERKVLELEQSKFAVLKHEIEGSLSNHHKNLMSLRDVPPIQAIISALDNNDIEPEYGNSLAVWRERLSVIFSAFLVNHPEYQQIRYIAADGDELVRVQAGLDGVRGVPFKQLQNKADSLYVSETIKLREGEVYYSDVSLNREHGVIQEPHQPVLRLASPIFNDDGQVAALLVINLSIEWLFDAIHPDENGTQRNIADDRGNYIKHADVAKTFGMDLGSGYRLQLDEPELAEISAHQDRLLRRHTIHNELDGFQKIYFSPQDRNRYWLLTLNIPENVVFSDVTAALNQMLLISLLIASLSLLLIVWFISRKILTPVVDLAAAASRLQAGDLTVRVDASSAHDEFKTLYAALNAFADNQQQATTQLENRVAAQTKRLSAVIDNVVDGIITISVQGEIESFNPAARRIFGYTDEEVIGQNVKMLMPDPYHSEHDDYLQHHIKTGEKKVIGVGREVSGLRKNGATFPMELAVSEVMIDGVRHFVGITRDVTERKRVELMQKEFISTVSHELRTPLTSIRGSLSLILGGAVGVLPEKAKALLNIANNNSDRLIHLINDILDIEKITSGNMQFDNAVTDALTVVQRAIESNKGYADQLGVRFELISVPDEVVMIRVDKQRMEQVMSNLMSNAAKYSPVGDAVEIAIEVIKEEVRITVHDHGKGIPEEFKPRIFCKFSQADSSDARQKGGTGLGLNITKELIEEQGGRIGFESGEDVGTTFYVDLPIWREQCKDDKPQVDNISRKTNSDMPLVLIVEDDRDVSRLLGMMLEKEGYGFHQAFTYQEALQQIQDNHYSVVTLDLMIPGGSGINLLRELRDNEATATLPVIVVSAKAKEGKLEVKGDAFCLVDWVEKPIDESRLLSSIRIALHAATVKDKRILHAEDDPDIAVIVDTLVDGECEVVHAMTLAHAATLVCNGSFDLVLLDIGLPDGSGLELLPVLANQAHFTPVIIFSAQDVTADIAAKVQGSLVKSKTDNKRLLQKIKVVISGGM